MKNKKGLIALVICAVLLVGAVVFVAFGGFGKEQPAERETAQVETKEQQPVTEEAPELIEPEELEELPNEEIVFGEVDRNDTIYIVEDQAELWEEPSVESELVANAPKGANLRRTGVSVDGLWSRITFDNQECYVEAQFISDEQVEMQAADNDDIPDVAEDEDTVTPQTGQKIVVIDPGHQAHGDSNQEAIGPGASTTKARVASGTTGSVSGWAEYQLNLEVSLQLRNELVSRGYTVYMTRETHDVNISNMERAQVAAQQNGDILVRIHANGSTNSSVSGALCMAPSNSNPFLAADIIAESQRLSQTVIDNYVATTGLNNQGVHITDEMSGINWTTMPVTIVEMGYMSNASDDAKMADAQMQGEMVKGIANGIDSYFGQ